MSKNGIISYNSLYYYKDDYKMIRIIHMGYFHELYQTLDKNYTFTVVNKNNIKSFKIKEVVYCIKKNEFKIITTTNNGIYISKTSTIFKSNTTNEYIIENK